SRFSTGRPPAAPLRGPRGRLRAPSGTQPTVGYPQGRPRPPGASAEPLDDGRVRHAAALAHRLEAVAAARALELVEQRGHEARPRAAEWVAKGDGAAVRVDPRHVGVQLTLPREDHRGERLV